MTSITDKKFIENSEHCVGFGYTIGRHDETYIKANRALLTGIEKFMPNPKKWVGQETDYKFDNGFKIISDIFF